MIEIVEMSLDEKRQKAVMVTKGDLCRSFPCLYSRCFEPIRRGGSEIGPAGNAVSIENLGETAKRLFLRQTYDSGKNETRLELSVNTIRLPDPRQISDACEVLDRALQTMSELILQYYDEAEIKPACRSKYPASQEILELSRFVVDGTTGQVSLVMKGNYQAKSYNMIDACFMPIKKRPSKPEKYPAIIDFGPLASYITAIPFIYNASTDETSASFMLSYNYTERLDAQTDGEILELLNKAAQETWVAMNNYACVHGFSS